MKKKEFNLLRVALAFLFLLMGPQTGNTWEYKLPEGIPYIEDGSFILQKTTDELFQIYRVDGYYALKKLVPVKDMLGIAESSPGAVIGFVDPELVAASRPPSYQMCYMVTLWEKKFSSVNEAISSIKAKSLGQSISGVCMDPSRFSTHLSTVYRM
jgi:hypothetical protein